MSLDRPLDADSAVQRAIAELEDLIRSRHPSAQFWVTRGEDPEGVYLKAVVDVEDTEEVVDLFIDRMLTMQIEEKLPVYVIPVRTPARVANILRQRESSYARLVGGAALAP
jgi:hypothetical protein